MDQIRPDLRNTQSMGSMDLIHFDHPDLGKKISQYIISIIINKKYLFYI